MHYFNPLIHSYCCLWRDLISSKFQCTLCVSKTADFSQVFVTINVSMCDDYVHGSRKQLSLQLQWNGDSILGSSSSGQFLVICWWGGQTQMSDLHLRWFYNYWNCIAYHPDVIREFTLETWVIRMTIVVIFRLKTMQWAPILVPQTRLEMDLFKYATTYKHSFLQYLGFTLLLVWRIRGGSPKFWYLGLQKSTLGENSPLPLNLC